MVNGSGRVKVAWQKSVGNYLAVSGYDHFHCYFLAASKVMAVSYLVLAIYVQLNTPVYKRSF